MKEALFLLAGFIIGVFSNIIPSWTEHREIWRSGDDVKRQDLQEAWVIVGLVSLFALFLVLRSKQL